VAWEVDAALVFVAHCHCSMCRKAHGAAFATFAGGPGRGVRWLRGEDLVARYASSPGGQRPFCSVCGSVVPNEMADGSMFFVPLGCHDDDPGLRPQMHIFVGSRAPWYELPADGLARFEEYPPGFGTPPPLERPTLPAPSSEDVIRGSCLCGGVAFEAGPARGLVYCHCTRCQKGRSAAFAANVFADAEPFRYTRGGDLVRSYKVPEAARFTVAFCTVCGGGVPHEPAGARYRAVPGGSLDDDPGRLPQIRIFVGSKAPWYAIADRLERYDEYPPGCASSHDWVARASQGRG
jgi:hypothetical protein